MIVGAGVMLITANYYAETIFVKLFYDVCIYIYVYIYCISVNL